MNKDVGRISYAQNWNVDSVFEYSAGAGYL